MKSRRPLVRFQRRLLGPLSKHERITLAALTVLLVGLVAQPLVHVDAAWLAVGALAVAVGGGAIDRNDVRSTIDWGFLTLFGVLLGSGGVLRHVGVDAWLGASLVPLAGAFSGAGPIVVLIGVFVVACRLALPWIPATLLLSLALVPAAPALGISAWVVGFVVLTSANTWLHPNQAELCRLMRDAAGGELFTTRQGLLVGCAISVLTIVALAASVPYWHALGILTP